jgi:putative transposase
MSDRCYTYRQIADALGKDASNIKRRANKENWPFTEETGRGGKRRLFQFDQLPFNVRKALDVAEVAANAATTLASIEAQFAENDALAKIAAEADADKAKEDARRKLIADGRKKLAALRRDDPKRLRAEAKYWAVTSCAQYRQVVGGTKRQVQLEFSLRLAAGEIDVPTSAAEWLPRKGGRIHVSEGTLQSWSDALRKEGIWGLVDGYGKRKGQNKVAANHELYSLVVGMMVKKPQIRAQRIIDFLAAEYPHLNIISKRRLQAFMKEWKDDNAQLWTYICNPDRWKNVYMAAAGTAFENISRLNQLWELDSTPADWMLVDGRHSVVGVIDMYSRRLKFFVSKTSTAAAVKQVTRRAILDWGIPNGVRTDNGKDYVAVEYDTLLDDLDIAHLVCIPFASEEKGTIERAMRTLSHGLLELLPGFIGHNVSERKAIEARKSFADRIMKKDEVVEVSLTGAELQAIIDQWTDHIYAHNSHQGLGGKSPWEVANAWTQPVLRVEDEHALDELLAPVGGVRTISKKGIRHDNRLYIDPTGVMYEYVGEEVMIRLDEDLGRVAVYYDNAFLCWAIDAEAEGINRREAAAAIKHHQKKKMAEQAAELRDYGKAIKKDIVQTVMQHKIETSENITALPKPSTPYTTQGLQEAAKAAEARRTLDQNPIDRIDPELEAKAKATIANFPRTPSSTVETGQQKYRRWMQLDTRLKNEEEITEEESRFYRVFQSSSTFKAQKKLHENFGLSASGH